MSRTAYLIKLRLLPGVTTQPFVIKIAKPQRSKEMVRKDWETEKKFMMTVNHPNCIQLYDAFIHNNLYYYVLEKASGSLRDLIDRAKSGKGFLSLSEVSRNGEYLQFRF